MPIDIVTYDGANQGTLAIDFDNPTYEALTIVGRSLTPPPDGGPELGPYCTGDGIMPPVSFIGTIADYINNKFQTISPEAVAPIIASLKASEQAETNTIDEILLAEAALKQKILAPTLKTAIETTVKQYIAPLGKNRTLILNLLDTVEKYIRRLSLINS